MKSHGQNQNTKSLVLKRDFTLNDIFYLFYYLLQNTSIRTLSLVFVETGAEKNSNAQMNENAPQGATQRGKKRDPLVLVPADRMDVTTPIFQPLGILSNNSTITCILYCFYKI